VGYIACDTKERNPPEDGYNRYDDAGQAAMVARTMYTWWALDTDVAPYYISIRSIVRNGMREPLWYGFFGFMDFIIDEHENARFHRYPAWYAYRTIASVFHDRRAFRDPTFAVSADATSSVYCRAYERKGRELLVMLWAEDGKPGTATVRIGTQAYGYPVRVALLNHEVWSDAPGIAEAGGVALRDVPVGMAPTILRLVAPRLARRSVR
jgi:hypothetical protein